MTQTFTMALCVKKVNKYEQKGVMKMANIY